jgi:hypothetical protein
MMMMTMTTTEPRGAVAQAPFDQGLIEPNGRATTDLSRRVLFAPR